MVLQHRYFIQKTLITGCLDFVNDISSAIDSGMKTIGIFMDLSKAFDTINHNILLNKLSDHGYILPMVPKLSL